MCSNHNICVPHYFVFFNLMLCHSDKRPSFLFPGGGSKVCGATQRRFAAELIFRKRHTLSARCLKCTHDIQIFLFFTATHAHVWGIYISCCQGGASPPVQVAQVARWASGERMGTHTLVMCAHMPACTPHIPSVLRCAPRFTL